MFTVPAVVLTLFAMSRGAEIFDLLQTEQDWPSCQELRMMWLSLRDIAQHSQLTNEIPLLPSDLLNRFSPNGHSSTHQDKYTTKSRIMQKIQQDLHIPKQEISPSSSFIHKTPHKPTMNAILNPISSPFVDHNPSMMSNFFEGFENVEPSFAQDNGFLLTSNPVKVLDYSPEVQQSNSMSSPEWEFGSFGRFSDEDEVRARDRASIRAVKSDVIGWHDVLKKPGASLIPTSKPHVEMISCDSMQNAECMQSEHCQCNGWISLMCVSGHCQVASRSGSSSGDLSDNGAWHNGPFPFPELGLANRKRRRSKRTKVM